MKLKLFLFILPIFISVSLFLQPNQAFASISCNIGSLEVNTRNLRTCIFGFDNVNDITGVVANFQCLANSNFDGTEDIPISCNGVANPDYTFSTPILCDGSNPNCNATLDGGKYFSCLTAQGINRAIGRLQVNFKKGGSNICSTDPINTKPANWDSLGEGLAIFHTGTNDPLGGNLKITCPDGISINTAVGCINTDFTGNGFITAMLKLAIGLGSGIALLLVLYGIFIVTTSAGIPDKLNAGRDVISSAIAGLIFIILSIFLLNLVGVKILAIPGL